MTGDNMDIPIIYRDKSLVVCLKPVGIDSEGAGMPALLSEQLGEESIFCVHRLDRAVGGVMVYALTKHAAAELSRQIGSGSFRKEYLAVIHGSPAELEAELRDLMFHDRARNKSYVVKRKRAGVKEASLSYRVLEERDGLSLLSVQLHTGRTHQIRVQFASRAHPLVGDVKYGSTERGCPIALWSRSLGFSHPKTGRALSFEAKPPEQEPWDRFQIGGTTCDTLK